MASLNPPLIFKTYQDVKNNLVYWVVILLILSSIYSYFIFLDSKTRQIIIDYVKLIGDNELVSVGAGAIILVIYFGVAIVLIYGLEIHDKIYDKYFIKWRDTYDLDFILPKLIDPIKNNLPENFFDFASKYKYKFMKPFYEFAGDEKKGIEENTRVRFYERITWYWITQLNEVFTITLIIGSLIYFIFTDKTELSINIISITILGLIIFGLINRWLAKYYRKIVSDATVDEIEEIHSKKENITQLKKRYQELCDSHKL